MTNEPNRQQLQREVAAALDEDAGSGDLTAALIPAGQTDTALIVCREPAVLCGRPWVDEVFRQLDADITIHWHCEDGDAITADTRICTLKGNTRALLTGERTALNFLQCLSGTATATRQYVDAVSGTGAVILDTRKTVPNLRLAQKYAVRCGGGGNHRMGLYDAILIKENHIRAAGSVTAAVTAARGDGIPIEVEVENLSELDEAINAGADRLLLDNFDTATMQQAVQQAAGRVQLEASGDVNLETVAAIAATGIDFISIGALTKHVRAIDYSMLFDV